MAPHRLGSLHQLCKRIRVDTGTVLGFRSGRHGQHRLHVDAARRQLEIQSLRREQREGFGRAVDLTC
jgi:hypothetical protein